MEQYKNQNGKYSLNPETLFSNRMIYDTIKYQKKYGFEIGNNNSTWNNEADAFKHAYMQATLAIRGNQDLAKFLGDGHEQQGADRGQPSGEENMDLWNNYQGRKIANQIMKEYGSMIKFYLPEQLGDIVSEKVMEKMRNGELITRPDDTRKYEDLMKGNPTGYATQVEPFTRENIGSMLSDEFSKNERAIMAQLKEYGIPSEKDLPNGKKSNFHKEKSKSSKDNGSSDGKWVTINGNHVLIKD